MIEICKMKKTKETYEKLNAFLIGLRTVSLGPRQTLQ